ncbi:flagellar basal body rod protein FlgB [Paenibacillus sp. sgz302251]|uniref:flagellar basal body rod protein FlgB n=1 Tax=Paenibacillus sp. sgz302251 TaxID=3414493 RepID=UPI003C7D1354
MISMKPTLNERVLEAIIARHETITNNIANADTPHYKKKSVVFEEELNRRLEQNTNNGLALRRTYAKHMPFNNLGENSLPYKIVETNTTTMNNNGNNVDIDSEMAQLAENQLMQNYLIDRVNGQYSKVKTMLRDLR